MRVWVESELAAPSPGEFFEALGKLGKQRWKLSYRQPPATGIGNRLRIAIAAGTILADGMVAAVARDVQQVKNVTGDLRLFCKSLGIEKLMTDRIRDIDMMAERDSWDGLLREYEAATRELERQLRKQRDTHLAILMEVGLALRVYDIGCEIVAGKHTREGALLVTKPRLIEAALLRLRSLPLEVQKDPLVEYLTARLSTIYRLSQPEPRDMDDPVLEQYEVAALRELTATTVEKATQKPSTK